MIGRIQFIIGDSQSFTPLDGTNELFIEGLPKDILIIKSGELGPLFEGIGPDCNYTRDYTGKITLNGEAVFSDEERYTIIY